MSHSLSKERQGEKKDNEKILVGLRNINFTFVNLLFFLFLSLSLLLPFSLFLVHPINFGNQSGWQIRFKSRMRKEETTFIYVKQFADKQYKEFN